MVVTGGNDERICWAWYMLLIYSSSPCGEPRTCVLVRQPLVFPETLPLLQALEQFRSARTHFAFVVDEFGSVEGMVTLSDVMETIAGNLPNEVDD
jgi:CBS domain containing-hemolysin-like protein